MKRVIFAFCIFAGMALCTLPVLAQEVIQDENVVSYDVGHTGTVIEPVTIRWQQSYLSFTPSDNPWIMFSSYLPDINALPIHLSIRLSVGDQVLDPVIVPDELRRRLEGLSYMASETLRMDEEAGKLSEEAISVLAALRDWKYSFTDDMGNYIDLRWGYSYAGKAKTLGLDFSDGDGYFHASFSGDGFTASLLGSREPGSLNCIYSDSKFTGTYGYGRPLSSDEALKELKSTLDSIRSMLRITKQDVPADVQLSLALMEKAIKGGFAEYKEEPAPAAGT
jgi:hypothetical protein